tara:strand:+ start:3100 stop:3564 length:465 start_codon:yes stop_codon:yes gene_type:complete
MPAYVDGRPYTGTARMMHLGKDISSHTSGQLDNAYETVFYEGSYGDTAAAGSALDAIDVLPFTDFSLVWENGHASKTVSIQVYVSNQSAPPAVSAPTNMDSLGWAQLGATTTVAADSAEAIQWTGKYKWLSIVATGSAATTNLQEASLYMSNSV